METTAFVANIPVISITADCLPEAWEKAVLAVWNKGLEVKTQYDKPEDLARAYDMLSRADVFRRRIKRWQHWRFLVYINALISGGVAVSKDEKYRKFVEYRPTGRILKMWWAKQKNMKKKAIAQKIAMHTHTSTKSMIKNVDYFSVIFKNDKQMADAIAADLELDKDITVATDPDQLIVKVSEKVIAEIEEEVVEVEEEEAEEAAAEAEAPSEEASTEHTGTSA